MLTRSLLSVLAFSLGTGAVQAQQWVVLDGPSLPSHGAVFDSVRNRVVAFGGEGCTWHYDGATLLQRVVAGAVPPRTGAAIAYDSARRVVLMFGGMGTAALSDTWTLAGNDWQQAVTASPPPRTRAGIAFDSWRSRAVLFGGEDPGVTVFQDTWEHDGSQWLQRQPITVPAPFLGPRMTFDSARGVTVMVTATNPMSVWEWNSIDWLARTPAGQAPAARNLSSLCFDPLRQRTVMIGGDSNGNEVWEWDGNAWHMPAVLPFAPLDPSLYFDPQRGAVVILGGMVGGASQDAAWSWNGTTLANLWPNRRPASRFGSTWLHDPVRNRTVMFGAATGGQPETWEWDGEVWIRCTPLNSPPPRQHAGTCFDPVRGTCLLFGGSDGSTLLTDFWQWNGSNWTQIVAPGGPTTPFPAMAWDSARSEVIAFGGGTTSSQSTWRWDGTAWTAVGPSNPPGAGPSFRTQSAMAFDPGRGRMVLFGGGLALPSQPIFAPANDTWEWDGVTWQQMAPLQSPPAFLDASMVYDPMRGRILLVGARAASTPANHFEGWEYDGTTWSQVGTWFDLMLQNPRLAWSQPRQCAVLFDGTGIRELIYGTVASADPVGVGCATPPPVLSVRTRPRPGRTDFGLELNTRPGLPVLFALGLGQGSTSLGFGCTLLIQQVTVAVFVLAPGNGIAIHPVPLPRIQALRGLVIHAQGGALDPLGPNGLAVSQALRITVGP